MDVRIDRASGLRRASVALALVVLATLWIEVDSVVDWYPTWLSLGEVTVPTLVIAPTALALVVLASVGSTATRRESLTPRDVGMGTLATLVLAGSTIATVTLNQGNPGVFWAGFLPLVTGFALALAILAESGLQGIRILTAGEDRPRED